VQFPTESLPFAFQQPFPLPPVDGEPGYIEPIRDAGALCWEGIQMGNCAFSYLSRVLEGETYFFRGLPRYVLQRCTIRMRAEAKKGEFEIGIPRNRRSSTQKGQPQNDYKPLPAHGTLLLLDVIFATERDARRFRARSW
jgi:hypothetical protein